MPPNDGDMVLALAAAFTVAVSPAQPTPNGLVQVRVDRLSAPAADVLISGGIASGGKMFGLVPLRDLGGGSWTTVLRAPGFYGVYPIEVRAEGVYHDTGALVMVLPRRFGSSLAGATPDDVVEKWREAAPNGVTVARHTTWRQGFYYHRDQRYNDLVRVTYTLLSDWPRYHLKEGTATKWFDLVRTSLAGKWHLVQVVDAP
jgi:hypothetical protein